MSKYLDLAGLQTFWQGIKTYVTNAVKVTGVKGNAESSYRTGNVNLTAANVGAAASSHTHDDRYYTETETDARFKKYIPYASYRNTNGSNAGKYYKISINSYNGWMLNFTVRLYHTYRAYDLQISGYNYGSSHWYSPAAVILGASVTNAIEVSFGYDSDYHLWVAIPAEQYSGVSVYGVTNGYLEVTDKENLFSIDMVTGMPSTLQSTKTAYRPWYRDETVTNATNATNASKVNNLTVQTAVPANAVFTDTVTTATTSGNGNAVTAISASNGALTVTKGTTFLTSHQDISGKADKSATVSTVAWDSTNKKLTKTINGTTTDVVTAATLRTGLNVADGAEVNQNAFSNVKVGSTTVAADSKTDTLELVAGSNVTLTPDATNDKVTIAATDTTYESKAAASGGTAVSLVTTGEKYTWNHKMSSIADVTNMELLTYEGTTNDVMTVGLHDDEATAKVPVVNATTGKIPASVYNNTTYESKAAASGGTAVSLVTTGEKYTWNNKSSLALGEASSTAYRGDRGKTAYDHSQATHARTDATAVSSSSTNGNIKINGTETTVYTHPGSGTNPHGTTKSDVGLSNVGNFKAVSTVASQGLTDTEKSNARTNIGAGTSSLTLGTSGTTAAYGNHNHTGVYSPVGHTHDGINIDIDNGGSYIPVSNIEAGDNVTLDYNNQNDTLTINATGGGGTSNYNSLSNRPQINSTTLTGNKTSSDLGLQSALSTSPPTPTVSATKGTKVSAEMRKYGNIIQFTLTFKNTSSVGSGSNVFEGTLSTNKPLQTISACGYYSSNALPMSINSSGSIVVRNAGSSAITCSSNTTIGATWII